MLPNQASAPLRRMLRPCFRLYQQQCSPLSAAVVKPGSDHKRSSVTENGSKVCRSDGAHSGSSSCMNSPYLEHVKSFSTSCSHCDVARERAEQAEKKSMKLENGEKATEISNASLDKLKLMGPLVQNAYFSCLIIQRLSVLQKEGGAYTEDVESLLQEAWLRRASQTIDQNVMKLSPKLVVATLQSLYEITAADVYLVKTLIIQVQWLLRRLPMPALIQVLQLHLSHQETPLRASVLQQCISTLERRWVELTNPKDIVLLMYTMQDTAASSQSLEERLEDRALDVIEKASPKELYRILYLLSRQRHRNTPLIRAVVYHLNKMSPFASLSTVHLTNLVYALAALTVYDVPVLSKLSEELSKRGDSLTPKLVSSLIESFSRLRWRENTVFHLLLAKAGEIQQTQSSQADTETGHGLLKSVPLTGTDKASMIVSLANLNLDSERSKGLVAQWATSPDVQALRQSNPLLWLDVVWSLSVLRMLDASSAASVLTEDFWGNMSGPESFQSTVNLTKVNNINTAAKYEVDGYQGPFLPNAIATCDAKLLQKGERSVSEKLVSALTNMAPLESYTLTNTTGPGGYLIDAEFYVNDKGEPKALSQVQQNPAGCHRMALKVLDFPDLTLMTSDLTGLQAMAIRHLQCEGYTVLQVRHTDVSSKSKVVELVQLLQQKVKDALKVKVTQPGS